MALGLVSGAICYDKRTLGTRRHVSLASIKENTPKIHNLRFGRQTQNFAAKGRSGRPPATPQTPRHLEGPRGTSRDLEAYRGPRPPGTSRDLEGHRGTSRRVANAYPAAKEARGRPLGGGRVPKFTDFARLRPSQCIFRSL